MQGFNGTPPVNVGDELDVQVEAVGEKGDGIVKVKGFVLFVPGVRQGENIRIRVNKVLSKVGFAEKIGTASAPVDAEMNADDTPNADVEEDEQYEDSEDFGEDSDDNSDDSNDSDIDDEDKQ